MAKSVLNVELREAAGKGVARTLRRDGKIPGVIYGKDVEPCKLVVDPKALAEALKTDAGMNTLITLKGNGSFDGKVVVLKDLEVDPIRRDPMHVDFYAIDLKQKGSFLVPVVPVGKSEGEKIGGSLQVIRHELEVLCLPGDVPTAIEINVEALNIGDVVHVEDVVVPKDVEIPHDVNFTVITVVGHKAEETEAEGEEGEVVEATEASEED
ncbi:MAG: 50S ribosomal protein L25 [Desulfuromonas sp.]|nr:MAG: 50S ribosomal protein L25 [Desulfuromonas sp.]